MEFGLGAVLLNGVVGGGVDVPSLEVDGLVDAVLVEGEVGSVEVDSAVDGCGALEAVLIVQAESWAIAPVVVLSTDLAGVVESRDVRG